MRVATTAVLMLAACYSPSPPAGAACALGDLCPAGLTCSAGVCVASGSPVVDAPSHADAPMIDSRAIDARAIDAPGDRDGDGVPDAVDNCPDTPNPGQENEDGDKFGDACDPCPPFADDNPPDTDGDGVADACDPHPTTPGDKITLFEGFHHGIPASWNVVGTWTGSNDDAVVTGTGTSYLTTNTALAGDGQLVAGITPTAIGSSANSFIQVSLNADPSTHQAINCNFDQLNGTRAVVFYDDYNGGGLAGTDFVWSLNQAYAFEIQRGSDGTYACAYPAIGSGTSAPTTGGTPQAVAETATAISAGDVSARVAWVMLISSP